MKDQVKALWIILEEVLMIIMMMTTNFREPAG